MNMNRNMIESTRPLLRNFCIALISMCALQCTSSESSYLQPQKDQHILLIGNNLGSRMMNFGHFETEMHMRYPDSALFIRNMCDGGDTPGFRPHSGRKSPWAFPAEEMNDLSDDPVQGERVRKLFADLVDLQEQMGDDLDLGQIGQSLPRPPPIDH